MMSNFNFEGGELDETRQVASFSVPRLSLGLEDFTVDGDGSAERYPDYSHSRLSFYADYPEANDTSLSNETTTEAVAAAALEGQVAKPAEIKSPQAEGKDQAYQDDDVVAKNNSEVPTEQTDLPHENLPAPKKTEVLEGEMVYTRETVPGDKILAAEDKLFIIGGNPDVTDQVLRETVLSHVERLEREDSPSVVLIVDAHPAKPSSLVTKPEKDWYALKNQNITEDGGILDKIEPGARSEVLANMAAGADDRTARSYRYLLDRISYAFEAQAGTPPSARNLRDSLRYLRDELRTDAFGQQKIKLTKDQREAVEDSMLQTIRKANQAFFEPLGQELDLALPDKPAPPQGNVLTAEPNTLEDTTAPSDSKITLLNLGVQDFGQGLRSQTDLANNTALVLLAKGTPGGKVGLAVFRCSPPKILLDECARRDIPFIVLPTVGDITHQSAPLLAGGGLALCAGIGKPEAAAIESMLPVVARKDPTHMNFNDGAGGGAGAHGSVNQNFKIGAPFPEGDGRSGSSDDTSSVSAGVAQSVSLKGPLLTAEEIINIGQKDRRDAAILSSKVNVRPNGVIDFKPQGGPPLIVVGKFDTTTRRWVENYPPPSRIMDTSGEVDAYRDRYYRQRGQGPAFPTRSYESTQKPLELPPQEQKRLDTRYFENTGHSTRGLVGRALHGSDYLRRIRDTYEDETMHRFNEQQRRHMHNMSYAEWLKTQPTFDEWARRRGIDI